MNPKKITLCYPNPVGDFIMATPALKSIRNHWNIGVALDNPVIVVMGRTHPAYSDVGHHRTIVLREDIDCSPCHLRVCPTDHRCMELITPEKVLNVVDKLSSTQVRQ